MFSHLLTPLLTLCLFLKMDLPMGDKMKFILTSNKITDF